MAGKTSAFHVPWSGVVVPGAETATDARAAAKAWLTTEHGVHPDEADEIVAESPRPALAWWGGDEVGFVQEHHEGAVPVRVVALPAEFHAAKDPDGAKALAPPDFARLVAEQVAQDGRAERVERPERPGRPDRLEPPPPPAL